MDIGKFKVSVSNMRYPGPINPADRDQGLEMKVWMFIHCLGCGKIVHDHLIVITYYTNAVVGCSNCQIQESFPLVELAHEKLRVLPDKIVAKNWNEKVLPLIPGYREMAS